MRYQEFSKDLRQSYQVIARLSFNSSTYKRTKNTQKLMVLCNLKNQLIVNYLVSMSKENNEVASKLIKITVLSLLFMAAEFIGGYLANSIAIWSDAFHLLSDVLAYVISLVAVLLSEKKSPVYLSFGWLKAQTLGALFNVAFIYIVTIELFIEATHRMIKKDKVEEPFYMLITSIFGLICNFIILSILHSDPNGGHHGCSHDHGNHLHSQEHQHEHHHDGKPCSQHHLPLAQISKTSSAVYPNSKKHGCSHEHQHHQHGNEHDHNHIHQSQQVHHSCQKQHHPHSNQHKDHSHQHDHHHHQKGSCSSKKKSGGCQKQDYNTQLPFQSAKKVNKQQILMESGLLSNHQSDQEIRSHENKGKMKNINLQAAYIHIITDIILSIGVIIAALIIYFFAGEAQEWSPWHLADPLCTYLFSFLAIYSTWPILKESFIILLDGCDNPHLIEEIERELKKIHEVREVTDLKIWSMNRGKYYAAVRVRMQKGAGSQQVKRVFVSRGIDCFLDTQQQQMGLKQ